MTFEWACSRRADRRNVQAFSLWSELFISLPKAASSVVLENLALHSTRTSRRSPRVTIPTPHHQPTSGPFTSELCETKHLGSSCNSWLHDQWISANAVTNLYQHFLMRVFFFFCSFVFFFLGWLQFVVLINFVNKCPPSIECGNVLKDESEITLSYRCLNHFPLPNKPNTFVTYYSCSVLFRIKLHSGSDLLRESVQSTVV